MTLPTGKQSWQSLKITPLNARVMLAGMPKSGKSTLAAGWSPDSTLIVDTQKGSTLLEGEHYVAHVGDWRSFAAVVDDLVGTEHKFKTVVLDMVDDLWAFVDQHCAGKGAVLATATEDYNRSAKSAEGTFRQQIGRLLATDIGVWFLTHTREVQENGSTRYSSRLDNRVLTYVQGASHFVLLCEHLGTKYLLHTQPSAKFEAGTRVPLPEPMNLNPRELYAGMAAGLAPPKKSQPEKAAPALKTGEEPAETDGGRELIGGAA